MNWKTIPDNNTDFDSVIVNGTPECIKHGAMNKVSVTDDGGGYWRCLQGQCRSGCIEVKNDIL